MSRSTIVGPKRWNQLCELIINNLDEIDSVVSESDPDDIVDLEIVEKYQNTLGRVIQLMEDINESPGGDGEKMYDEPKSIKGCARCGGAHDKFDPEYMINSSDDVDGFWICPETNQPVLVNIVNNVDVQDKTR